jgi:type II secretory pathway component GspD/PulD (secretin)
MRHLKVATDTNLFELSNVPENLKFIEKIAKQYSKTIEELKHNYAIGLSTIESLELKELNIDKTNIIWTIRQAILADQRG